MSKPIPRSRLNISYRTKIDGRPKKAKLPMRFLVLGDFTAHDRSLLDEREVHSIMPGMRLDSFMEELKVSAPIDDELLRERLFGALTGEVEGKFTKAPGEDDSAAKLKISGRAVVSGEAGANGLGSFVGEVEVSGEVELPVENRAVKLPEDGSKVTLTLYGKVEPPAGAEVGVTGNVEAKIEVTLTAKSIDDDDFSVDLRCAVAADKVPVDVTIPLRSMSDFKPLHLAASVPELRRLVLLHRLVLEARNFISSFPELREVVKAELADTKAQVVGGSAGEDTRLGKLSKELRALYPQLLVDPRALAPANAGGGAGGNESAEDTPSEDETNE
ncbi:type VI secretion system contractile sheath small subunit [Pseudenhygromyxa sp. WMMC2535]|uniref:type VI secretion system contractile sheath small subunit n=1 Tax=Pseudenhygromyxa sp. WMMC2535 TaxID=2712867 RepID=UPI001551E02C|nr:type VI secretion system contractile sheath small subunit [Pseudenhygromyxa sp. WMMC2535]NVB39231.1 type VI secretion system contractile sheath small subunit [Pseudenhygromyxa sp. WMMC2535]